LIANFLHFAGFVACAFTPGMSDNVHLAGALKFGNPHSESSSTSLGCLTNTPRGRDHCTAGAISITSTKRHCRPGASIIPLSYSHARERAAGKSSFLTRPHDLLYNLCFGVSDHFYSLRSTHTSQFNTSRNLATVICPHANITPASGVQNQLAQLKYSTFTSASLAHRHKVQCFAFSEEGHLQGIIRQLHICPEQNNITDRLAS
jgi:hypothetical protein